MRQHISLRPLLLAFSIANVGTVLAQEEDTTLTVEQPIETVTVWGQRETGLSADAATGALGARPILDTPFSISVLSSEEIAQHQISSLENLFGHEASVSVQGGAYSNFGSTLSVRGLPLDYSNSYKINGLSLNNFSGELPYEVFERIELLKGATGFMYGFAAPGGVINYVTKKPTGEKQLAINSGFRSDAIYNAHLDTGGHIGDRDSLGYRLNLGYEYGDTVNDDGKVKRKTAALSLDYRLSEALYWHLDMIYNDRHVNNSVSWMNNWMSSDQDLPHPVDGSRNLGVAGSFDDSENLIAMTGLDWSLSENWHLGLDYSYTENNTRWIKTMPNLENSQGDLSIRIYDQAFDMDFRQYQLQLNGHFSALGMDHQFVSGAAYQKTIAYRSDPTRIVEFLPGMDNLYRPASQHYDSVFKEQLEKVYYTSQRSAWLSDTVELGSGWSTLLGLRYNDYEYAEAWSNWTAYEEDAVTPVAALMYKPAADTMLYISYVEALEQGGTVGETYANANEMLPPLESEQYEAGLKLEKSSWVASAALFRIERSAEYVNNHNVYVQKGVTRYDGLEIEISAQLHQNWLLRANGMYLSTRYQKTGPDSTIKDNDVAATPKKQGSFHISYQVPAVSGLNLEAGAKYYGEMPLDADNIWILKDYTLFDVGISYNTQLYDKEIILRSTATNLSNKAYWSTDGWGLRIGEPRTVALSMQVIW